MDEIEIDREALIQTFVAESDEILGGMEQALVTLESRPDDEEILHALFRAAHTLKGSASLVGFDAVRAVAHGLEDLLERLRSHALAVSDGLITLLLESVDLLRGAVADAVAGRGPTDALQAFQARVAEIAAGADAAPAGAATEVQPAAPSAAKPAGPASPGARTLRVDVAKLDRMLDLSGEIAISRGRLADMLENRASLTLEEILAAHRDADRLYLDLQELIMKARMVPIGPVFHQQHRVVRDVAASHGKQVRLVIEGEDVEVDTAIVEHIRDPLNHMVRNALDHGIEPPALRAERGKDPCGVVTLRAFHEAGSIVVEVQDDGAGLDRARIAARAQALGLVADASKLAAAEADHLVFEPGLSTSETVTELSGRGVGMDVVRRNVEGLRGSVSVASESGQGTTVTIRLPLTLAIIQGFMVGVAGQRYILPLDAVEECLELPEEERGKPGSGVVNMRGRPLPYLRLRDHFGLGGAPASRENVVVVRQGSMAAGIAVDALQGETQTVVKPLGRMFRGIPGISGSSIMGDGNVALILDVTGLLREALRRAAAAEA